LTETICRIAPKCGPWHCSRYPNCIELKKGSFICPLLGDIDMGWNWSARPWAPPVNFFR